MARLKAWIEVHPAWAWGSAVGFLPFVSAILFRTYSFHVTPEWYELFRQFDVLFVMLELGVIFFARERGMQYAKLWTRLSMKERLAACVFLGTFWISSVFVSQVPALSTVRIVIWCIHIAFACAVFHLSGTVAIAGMERFAKACFLGLCAYVPVLAVHFAIPSGAAQPPEGLVIWTSALPGYLSVRLFGFTMAALTLLAVGLLWHRSRIALSDWWLYAGLIISLTFTFWSGTRGGFYAVFLASFSLPLLARKRPHFVWVAAIAAATLLAALLSESLYQPDAAFGLFRSESSYIGKTYTSGRYEIWLRSIELIAQRPLLGWGESAIMWLLNDNAGHQQPHNVLLQMLLSWGAIATVAASYLLIRLARALIVGARRESTVLAPVIVLLGLAVMSSVDGILYNPRTTILVIIAAASALAIILERQGSETACLTGRSDGPETEMRVIASSLRGCDDLRR